MGEPDSIRHEFGVRPFTGYGFELFLSQILGERVFVVYGTTPRGLKYPLSLQLTADAAYDALVLAEKEFGR
jgi:hypothetical protein